MCASGKNVSTSFCEIGSVRLAPGLFIVGHLDHGQGKGWGTIHNTDSLSHVGDHSREQEACPVYNNILFFYVLF